MKDRISKILREEGMTAAKFASEIGVQASSISHIISGRNKPSTDFLIKLLERFRGINAEWLLTGKGEMYKSSQSGESGIEKPIVDSLFSQNFAQNETNNDSLEQNNEKNSSSNDKYPQEIEEKALETPLNSEYIPKNTQELPKSSNSKDKTVEKIVIFFTDNTFESYNPNNQNSR